MTEHAYHGVTTATTRALAGGLADRADAGRRASSRIPAHREAAPTSPARSTQLEADLAATFLDGSLMSDGIYVHRRLRSCGCSWSGRTPRAGSTSPTRCRPATAGSAPELWSFARHGIAPDIVTLGKPMGNGHPLAAVIARRELVEQFTVS